MRAFGLAAWLAALLWTAPAAVQAAPGAAWFDWRASRDGVTHAYVAQGFTLALSSRPGPAKDSLPKPVLKISTPGAPPLTLVGEEDSGDPAALVGVVRLDPASTRPQVLLQSYSGGAHCCTTLKLAILTGAAWRAYTLTFDGGPDKQVVDLKHGEPPVLFVGDNNFDYAFASHAGSYFAERYYSVRGGRLYDVSGEPRFAGTRRASMALTLRECGNTDDGPDSNGGCAAYVAEASLLGEHDSAWRRMLARYDKTANLWPDGCRVDPGAGDCPKGQTIAFKSFPQALAWFLWRYGYAPPAPAFACEGLNCPVPWPKTPAP